MKLNKLIITGLAAAFLSSFVVAKPGGGGKDKKERPPKREFSEVDADSDGKVSLAEFIDGAPDAEKATARFEKKDQDADGFLSEEEYNTKGKKGKGKGKKKKGDE